MSCSDDKGCPSGGSCHHLPGCKDHDCPGHPGRHAPKRQAVGLKISFIWQSPRFFTHPGLYLKINNSHYRIIPVIRL